jgi:hypothetical protein
MLVTMNSRTVTAPSCFGVVGAEQVSSLGLCQLHIVWERSVEVPNEPKPTFNAAQAIKVLIGDRTTFTVRGKEADRTVAARDRVTGWH